MDEHFPFFDDPDFQLEKYRAKWEGFPLSPELLQLLDKVKERISIF